MHRAIPISSDFRFDMQIRNAPLEISEPERIRRENMISIIHRERIFDLILQSELRERKPKIANILKLLWVTKETRKYLCSFFANIQSIRLTYDGVEVCGDHMQFYTRRSFGWKLLETMLRISTCSSFDDELRICLDSLHIDSTFAKRQSVRYQLLRFQSLKQVSGRFFTPITEGNVKLLMIALARTNAESIVSVKGVTARSVTEFLEKMPLRLQQSSLNIDISAFVNYDCYGYVSLEKLVFSAEVMSDATSEGAFTVFHKTRVPSSLRIAFEYSAFAHRVTELMFVVYSKPDDEAWIVASAALIAIKQFLPNIKIVNFELRYEGEFSLYSQHDTAALASNIACDLRQIQQSIAQLGQYGNNRPVPGRLSLNCGIEVDGHRNRVADALLEYGTVFARAFPTLISDNLHFTGILNVEGSEIDVTIAIWTNDWQYERHQKRATKRAIDEDVQEKTSPKASASTMGHDRRAIRQSRSSRE